MTTLLFILLALFILSLCVVSHEFGHYLVGRLTGIGVVEFAVGMGPKLFGFTRKGIKYSLRAIPIGGYCSFVGEDENSSNPAAMNNQPVWKRFLTVLAGPVFNFVAAFLLAVVLIANSAILNPYETETPPLLYSIVENMPAHKAGLLPGDVIAQIQGEDIAYTSEGTQRLREIIAACAPGEALSVIVSRKNADTGENERVSVTLTPEFVEEENRRMVGVSFITYYQRYDCNYITAAPEALRLMGRTVGQTVEFLKDLVVGIFRGEGVEKGSVSGVVGIVSMMSTDVQAQFAEAFATGIFNILFWIMALSLNLGIMNLLPLPALDGGRLVFLAIEGIRGKPLNREREGMVHLIGFGLLLVLMVVVTYSDIAALIG